MQPDRRSEQRYLSLLRVGTMIFDDRRELCLNPEPFGRRDDHPRLFRHGADDAVAVELRQGEPIGGKVAWVHEGTFGITFDEPIDVLGLIAPPDDVRGRAAGIELGCTAWVPEGANVLGAPARSTFRRAGCASRARRH